MATNVTAEALDESPIPQQTTQNKQTVDPYNVGAYDRVSGGLG